MTSSIICSIDECASWCELGHTLCRRHARIASPNQNVLARQTRSQRCSVDGCEERVTARGFCGMHYQRHAAGKPMDSPRRRRAPGRVCSVEGCMKAYHANGFCSSHNTRFANNRPLTPPFRKVMHYANEECSVDGCSRRAEAKGLCAAHYARTVIGLSLEPPLRHSRGWLDVGERSFVGKGYVKVKVPRGTHGADKDSNMLEHRYVMQEHLGRPLLQSEDVHHINGNRAECDLSNLELWTKSHPRGQRVSDKVAFSIEMISLYPAFTGLDLADQALLLTLLDRARGTGHDVTNLRQSRKAA